MPPTQTVFQHLRPVQISKYFHDSAAKYWVQISQRCTPASIQQIVRSREYATSTKSIKVNHLIISNIAWRLRQTSPTSSLKALRVTLGNFHTLHASLIRASATMAACAFLRRGCTDFSSPDSYRQKIHLPAETDYWC